MPTCLIFCKVMLTFFKSNDKLHLTETLQEEQHISKELGERLSQQEEELNELRDQVSYNIKIKSKTD